MNFGIELFLCAIAWAVTLSRLTTIHWKDIRKDNGIALNVWLMMVFFSITLLFLIKKFSDFFDAHTFNNLDRLIAYCSILTGIFFGAVASVEAVGGPSDKGTIRWLRYLLILTIITLVVIYSLFISRIPNINYYVPRSFPEVLFMVITFSVGATLCVVVDKVYLAYLPFEKSAVMRTRTILILMSTFGACSYFLVKIAITAGFFWPLVASQALINLSSILLIFSALSHFSALVSNKLYVPFVVISRNIRAWHAFKDLRHLKKQLQRLCPEVSFSTIDPSFWAFLLSPEYYLYRTVVNIMDGKTMLDDFLLEGALSGGLALWEGDMLREAVRVNRALQSTNSTGDFWEMVDEYKRASRSLVQGEHPTKALKNP